MNHDDIAALSTQLNFMRDAKTPLTNLNARYARIALVFLVLALVAAAFI